MGLSHSPRIVTDGLVFCVDAANKRSYPGAGTTWTDLTANKNNGTLQNMPDNFSTDSAGSLTFDGTNDYVNFGTPTIITGFPLTITSFIKRSSSNSRDVIFGNYYANSTNRSFQFEINNSNVLQGTCSSNGTYQSSNTVNGSTTINTDEVYHASCVMESGEARVYLNGVLDGTDSSWASALNTPVARYLIGAEDINSAGAHYFAGNIYSIQVYNRVLTPDEIKKNYNATKGRFQ